MTVLVYGAYGYTGELIAREAAERGLDLVVGGRNGTKTRSLGIELDAEARVFEAGAAASNLDGIDAVLNCAGPFVETAEPIVDACLETATHYLDVTGEIPVFEALVERDRAAEQAGVCLLPGVGFDVVPTDCLAAHLHERLPGGTALRLGIDSPGDFSGGTIASGIGLAGAGGAVRRDGAIESVPVGHAARTIDFGSGSKRAVSVPMPDVSTAYYTTGIENIDVFVAMPGGAEYVLRASNYATPLLEFAPLREGLQWLARSLVSGPSEQTRETERAFLWGEVTDGEQTVASRLVTPETYALTVDAATSALERVLDDAPIGYQTPASAFGPEFVLDLDGVEGFFDCEMPHQG